MADVWHDEQAGAWLLRMRSTCYAFALGSETDNPNQITGRRYPLRFRFHAAMAGALGIGGDLTRWSPSELTEARDLAATYKAIRPVVQRGRPYRLPRSAATGSAAPWSADRLTAEMLGSRADAPVSQGNRA